MDLTNRSLLSNSTRFTHLDTAIARTPLARRSAPQEQQRSRSGGDSDPTDSTRRPEGFQVGIDLPLLGDSGDDGSSGDGGVTLNFDYQEERQAGLDLGVFLEIEPLRHEAGYRLDEDGHGSSQAGIDVGHYSESNGSSHETGVTANLDLDTVEARSRRRSTWASSSNPTASATSRASRAR